MAFDKKYRPQVFSDVIGNDLVVKLLTTRSKTGTLHGRSMLFGGPKGCGKTTLARIVAKAIVCDNPVDGNPCNECSSCVSVTDENLENVDEFDAASQGTVDRIRGIVQDLDYGTFNDKPRIFILDEAHRLTANAQDALLKPIEDRRLVVILCTTEPHKIRGPVRSRLEEYPVAPPKPEEVVNKLIEICSLEGISYEKDALYLLAKSLKCCVRECVCAIETLHQTSSISMESVKIYYGHDKIEKVVDLLRSSNSDINKTINLLDELSNTEGPTWIRDTIVSAVTAAIRQSIGSKSNFPVDADFYHVKGSDWSNFAKQLSMLNKPSYSDIESIIFSFCNLPVVQVQITQQIVQTLVQPVTQSMAVEIKEEPKIDSKKIFKPEIVKTPGVTKGKIVEIDGIKFTSDETLTSIDNRIEKGRNIVAETEEKLNFDIDKRNAIMPECSFIEAFKKRIKTYNDS